MNNLINFEGNNIEILEHEGMILFNPKDIGRSLGLSEDAIKKQVQRMSDKQVVKIKNSDFSEGTNFPIRKLNNAGENFITESGVYKMVFASRSENAERFQDWVTDEVLPEIRQNGCYGVPAINQKEQLVLTIYNGGVDALESHKELLKLETEEIKKGENQQIKISELSKALGISNIILNDYLVENGYGEYKKANESKVFVPNQKFIEEIANEGHALTRVVNGNQRPTYKKSSIDYFLSNHLEEIRLFTNKPEVIDVEVIIEDETMLEVFAKNIEPVIIDKEKQKFITKKLQTIAIRLFNSRYDYAFSAFYASLNTYCNIDLHTRRSQSTTKKKGLVSFIYEEEFVKALLTLFTACPDLYSSSRFELIQLGVDVAGLDSEFNYNYITFN